MPSPEAAGMIETFRSQLIDPNANVLTFPEQRAMTARMFTSIDPLPDDVVTEEVVVAGVRGLWVAVAETDTSRAVLFLHGGGYCVGSIESHQGLAARIARAGRARVLVLDYHLAPEAPFPAGLEDAVSAYQHLIHSGFQPQRISIVGDSSGGGLAIATLVALRDRAVPLPAAGVALCPWGDLTLSGETITTKADEDALLTFENLDLWAGLYAGESPRSDPLISPVYADLSGLPPILLHVGTAEMLLSDAERLAKKISDDGGMVTFEPEEGLFHAYHLFPQIPEARAAVDRVGAFLQQNT